MFQNVTMSLWITNKHVVKVLPLKGLIVDAKFRQYSIEGGMGLRHRECIATHRLFSPMLPNASAVDHGDVPGAYSPNTVFNLGDSSGTLGGRHHDHFSLVV